MAASTGQRHQIMRQVLEVGGCLTGEARHALSDLRELYYRCLLPIIERRCSAVSPPDRVVRVDLLEIDLGALPLDGFEPALAATFEAAFTRALADVLATSDSDALDADLALLTYFLHTGMVPWWADRSDRRLLDSSLEVLIARAPHALREAVERAAADDMVWRRIARAFPDRLLDALAGVLIPPGSAIDSGAGLQWLQLVAETARACGQPASVARAAWWEGLLRASRTAGPAASGAPSVLANIFFAVARRLGVDDGAFVTRLHAAVGAVDRSTAASTARSRRLRDVPGAVWQDARRRGAVDLDASDAAASRSMTMGAQDGASDPTAPRSTTVSAQDGLAGSSEDAHVEAPQAQLPRDARSGRGSKAPARAESKAAHARERRTQAALRFSDADEAYVDNAGLVVLWPFLERLFGRLDLIDGRRFSDAAARQRAVGLLQYLATGDAEAPEFLVPLNKLLCGMPVDEVFDFGPPIAEAEIEVCGEVLTAAIEHAPILRDMSIGGFRSSFLLREGQLSARDGCWLLRVQRETHDIVLDWFPWTARVVKLPWMDTTLVVEW